MVTRPPERGTVPRRILLDVDGTLLIDDVTFRRVAPDDPPRPPVEAGDAPPPRAAFWPIRAPHPSGEGTFPAWYQPAVITALRDAHEAGIDIVWSTSWLAGVPAALDEMANLIGAGFVRRPTVKELPAAPNRYGLDPSSRLRMRTHWKLRAWRQHLETAETVLIDDDAYFTTYPFTDEDGLHPGGWIRPRYGRGFFVEDRGALRRWVHDGVLPATPRPAW